MPMLTMYIGGIIFGLGLAMAGATQPEVVLSFLRLEDMGLFLVIGAAVMIMAAIYRLIPKITKKPLLSNEFKIRPQCPVNKKTIIGAGVFGVGWGISGLCPATAFAAVGEGNLPIWFGIAGMFLGALVYGLIASRKTL